MGKKVLVVVDVQNDFVKGGPLAYGEPKESNTDAIVSYAAKMLKDGNYVVATRDTHHDNYLDTLEGQKLPVKHCMHETFGWDLVDGLQDLAHNHSDRFIVFDKPTFGTSLVAEYIRSLMGGEQIEEIQMAGYCLSICVLANAVILRSRFPNMKITILTGLCGDVNAACFSAALDVLANQQCDFSNSI